MARIKIFTHDDLDGFGCGYLLSKLHYNDTVDIVYTEPKHINTLVKSFFEDRGWEKYDNLYITDLNINKENAEDLNTLHDIMNISLYDHHIDESAMDLNKYEWAIVMDEDTNGKLRSATKLIYDELIRSCSAINITNNDMVFLCKLAMDISDYDTYQWGENDMFPKYLHDIYNFYKKDLFLEHLDEKYDIAHYENVIGPSEMKIIKILDNNFNNFLEERSKKLIKTDILGYKVGVVLADYDISALGNHLSKLNPDLDFIAMIGLRYGSISYRTTKDNINLGNDIARVYGGGGHKKAAGSPIQDMDAVMDLIIDEIFIKQ